MKRSLDKGAPSSLATTRNGYLQRLTQTQYGLDRRMHTLRLPRPYLLHHITPTLACVASLATARLSAIDTTKPAHLVRKRNTHSPSRVMDPDICTPFSLFALTATSSLFKCANLPRSFLVDQVSMGYISISWQCLSRLGPSPRRAWCRWYQLKCLAAT